MDDGDLFLIGWSRTSSVEYRVSLLRQRDHGFHLLASRADFRRLSLPPTDQPFAPRNKGFPSYRMMDRLHIIKKQEDNQHHLDEGSILMAEPAATANTLPAEIQAGLDRFRDEMETALGPELVALMVYGDVLCRDVNRSRLDGVNVMVVLRQVRLADLDKIMKPVKAAGKKIGLVPMVVSETDIKGSADVFPIKFLQIKHHHKLLYGTDVFQGMEVSKAHLRLRCEQELKNLMLRTRPRARAEQWSEGRRDYKPE